MITPANFRTLPWQHDELPCGHAHKLQHSILRLLDRKVVGKMRNEVAGKLQCPASDIKGTIQSRPKIILGPDETDSTDTKNQRPRQLGTSDRTASSFRNPARMVWNESSQDVLDEHRRASRSTWVICRVDLRILPNRSSGKPHR